MAARIEDVARFAGAQRVPDKRIELYIRRDFLEPQQCATLISLIDAHRRPSTIADDDGKDPAYRTSETCDLSEAEPVVKLLQARLSAFLGIEAHHGENLQGQRYAVGQEFKAHTDYFEPSGADYERYCAGWGQRTWTAMMYLNEPVAGGATRFKSIDKMIQPETGKLVCWNNRTPDGAINPWTLHHGMKVRAGTKYIVTQWYRERPRAW